MITCKNPAGFPESRINTVIEDRNRNIYGLTADGLARYNGHEFRLIQLPTDRSYNILSYNTAVDNNNIIWIKAVDTTGNKLPVRFDGKSYSEVHIHDDNFLTGNVKRITSIDDSDDLILRVNNHLYTWDKERLKALSGLEIKKMRKLSGGIAICDEDNNCFCFEDGTLEPLEINKKSESFIEPLMGNR